MDIRGTIVFETLFIIYLLIIIYFFKDVKDDIAGAQKIGIKGILVKTGEHYNKALIPRLIFFCTF